MRLGTCVALELLTGIGMTVGLAFSVSWGLGEFPSQWQQEARAADKRALDSAGDGIDDGGGTEGGRAASLPVAAAARADQDDSGFELDLSGATREVAAAVPAEGSPETAANPTAPGKPTLDPSTAGDLTVDPTTGQIIDPTTVPAPAQVVDHSMIVAVVQPPLESVARAADGDTWRDAPYYRTFYGSRDDELLAPLRGSNVKEVKFNRGGSSISLRIEFENGARAAFKPQQSAAQTIPRKEIAAYRIDRLLGIGAVPPAIAGRFDAEELITAMEESSQVFVPRLREEMRIKDGMVIGELSWWIPIINKAKVNGFEIDTTDGIVTWKRYLTAGNDMPREEINLLAQISSMVLFDFIINNPDRWSGANARVSRDDKFLYFMDNTMSFGADDDGHRKARIYFQRSQKFSRALIEALRELDDDSLRAVLSWDRGPYSYLLSNREIKSLLKRRDFALDYIDELIAEHGESAILVFP